MKSKKWILEGIFSDNLSAGQFSFLLVIHFIDSYIIFSLSHTQNYNWIDYPSDFLNPN